VILSHSAMISVILILAALALLVAFDASARGERSGN
jgi:hypothetical protein